MLFLLYFLKANIILAALTGFYLLVLRKSTFYTFNRVYILFAIVAALALPLAEFPMNIGTEFFSNTSNNVIIIPTTLSIQNAEMVSSTTWLQWQHGVLLLLALGFSVCIVRLLIQLISLYLFARKTYVRHAQGNRFNISEELIGPFSFFGFICINPSLYTEQELDEVIAHENAHVGQLHSVDIILLELMRCVFWINPFIHILRKEARQNLEYLADEQVVKMGFNTVHYQYTLLKVADSRILPVIVSEFRMLNLKKRIIMMNKSKASKLGLLRYGLTIPLLAFLWFLAAPVQAQEPEKKTEKSNTVMRIHGINTTGSGESPLIIVNGEEVANINLNSAHVESIAVLKDEAATKEYGEKGKNGVIIVTTKDGDAEGDATLSTHKVISSGSSTIVYGSNKSTKVTTLPEGILYIVDGKEASSGILKEIDPDDIASIAVLKDESATKEYGEKGKNGVIVITKKK